MDTYDPDQLLDVNEAAELLRVKVPTLYAWASRGKVPYRKVGTLLRFHRGELMQWTKVEEQTAATNDRARLRVVSLPPLLAAASPKRSSHENHNSKAR